MTRTVRNEVREMGGVKRLSVAVALNLGTATDASGAVVAAPRDDRLIRLTDAVSTEHVEIELSASLAPADGSWTNYAITVARRPRTGVVRMR